MIFCIERQLFCKGTFMTWKNSLFLVFALHYLLLPKVQPLHLRNIIFGNTKVYSLISANSPEKFYLLFLPLGSAIPENTRTLSGILNIYSKTKITSAGENVNVLTKTTKDNCTIQFAILELRAVEIS